MRKKFNPEQFRSYKNSGGGEYVCLRSDGDGNAIMKNVASRWTFIAHGCGIYPDGTIDWDHSTGGYFA